MDSILRKKIGDLADKCRANGYTQAISLELTMPELRQLNTVANPPRESVAARIKRDFMESDGPGPYYGPTGVGG